MRLRTLDDVELHGKTVLVRVDFNVPLTSDDEGTASVADDKRIRAALATINHLRAERCRVVLMSHLGRPKGPDPKLSLRPVAEHLSQLLSADVAFSTTTVGAEAEEAARALGPGDVLVLENLRFHAEEKQNDPAFAKSLAAVAGTDGFYVNDAFGTAHRAHASTRGVADHLPGCIGALVETEVEELGHLLHSPSKPFTVVMGGAKVSDKIQLIENLLPRVDAILIGGGMAFTFLKALGHDVGKSLLEEDCVDLAKNLLIRSRAEKTEIVLPVDVVTAPRFEADAPRQTVAVDAIPADEMGLDIGPATARVFSQHLSRSKTILLNGPMGVFEMPRFAEGTNAVIAAIAGASAHRVVGGGDSASAVAKAGYEDRMDHVSTGGGASLEFLEGKTLPGLEPFIVAEGASKQDAGPGPAHRAS